MGWRMERSRGQDGVVVTVNWMTSKDFTMKVIFEQRSKNE